jgi:hypothetical protein
MSRVTPRKTDQFIGRADDGREFEILEYTDFIDTPGSGGPSDIPGLKKYRLRNGTPVIGQGDGVYKIFPDGPIVRRV